MAKDVESVVEQLNSLLGELTNTHRSFVDTIHRVEGNGSIEQLERSKHHYEFQIVQLQTALDEALHAAKASSIPSNGPG